MKEKQRNTLFRAINHFGVEGQINKAVEEMGELLTELSRRNLARFDKDHVAEEVADALIMLEQLRIIFGGERVDGYVAEKLARLEKSMNGDWRRQERMMPKGMVKHLEGEESEARKGAFFGELLEAGLMSGLKSVDRLPRRCCLFCKHIRPVMGDEELSRGPWCGITAQEIIGNPRVMTCGRFEPKETEKGRENERPGRPVSEVVGFALLVAMLDSEKSRVPCCAKCDHLRQKVVDGFPMPFCPFHGIMSGDIEQICCTEYQKRWAAIRSIGKLLQK